GVDRAGGGWCGWFEVGYIEDARIGSAGKLAPERLARRGMRAVAAGEVGRFANFRGAVRSLQNRADLLRILVEAQELGSAFDLYAQSSQPLDEQPLVCILLVCERVGKRAQSLSELPQRQPRHPGAAGP